MTEESASIGDIATTTYKTGQYIAEVMERSDDKALVKVLAVLRHPTQGDLHNPGKSENVMFQQRRALAQYEKTWVHPRSLQLYQGTVPDYKDSLAEALNAEIEKLNGQDNQWAQRSIEQLKVLKHDYFKERS